MFKDIMQRPLPEEPGEVGMTRRPLLETTGEAMNNEPAMLEAGVPNFSRAEFRRTPFHTWYHSLKSPLEKKFRRPLLNCPRGADAGMRL